MKKGPVIAIIVVLALIASFFGYRSWKDSMDRDLAERRERDVDAGKTEAEQRAAAEAEAARLAQEKTRLDADENARKLAELRTAQAALDAERKKAEEAEREAAAEKVRLEQAKAAADQEASRLSAERAKAEADADAARQAAMEKLAELDRQKQEIADREAARLAALKHQQELESLVNLREILGHAVYPNDYKRRDHYYLGIEMINNEIERENDAHNRLSPLK
jgi:hypothetical protein